MLADSEAVSQFEGADAVVEIAVGRVFANCPRYVHDLTSGELSPFAPAPGHQPPEPEWKQWDTFVDVLPRTKGGE